MIMQLMTRLKWSTWHLKVGEWDSWEVSGTVKYPTEKKQFVGPSMDYGYLYKQITMCEHAENTMM